MGTVEPVGRFTFGINDDEVCEKLWIRCNVIGCSAIQNPWFRKSRIRRRVMGKQNCRANKCVTCTVIVERVNSLCQLLNLLGSEALYKISIGHDLLFTDKKWRGCQAPRSVLWYHIRKWYIKNGKNKGYFLFSYMCLYHFIYRKYILVETFSLQIII